MSDRVNYHHSDLKEVAKLMGVHPETIRRWAREGKIKVPQAGQYGYTRIKRPSERPGMPLMARKLRQRGS